MREVTVIKHKKTIDKAGDQEDIYREEVFLRGNNVNSIILPKDTIERYKGLRTSTIEKEAENKLDTNEQKESQNDNEKNADQEEPIVQRKPTSYGRGQRPPVQEVEEERQPGLKQPIKSSEEENLAGSRPRAYGRGQRPPPEKQNPTLSQQDQDQILSQLLQSCKQMNQNALRIQLQSEEIAKQQQIKNQRMSRKPNQNMSDKSEDSQNITKKTNPLKNAIDITQNVNTLNQTYLSEKQQQQIDEKMKELERKLVYPNLGMLMDSSAQEFLNKVKQNQVEQDKQE